MKIYQPSPAAVIVVNILLLFIVGNIIIVYRQLYQFLCKSIPTTYASHVDNYILFFAIQVDYQDLRFQFIYLILARMSLDFIFQLIQPRT